MKSAFYPQGAMRLIQGPPGSSTDTLPTAGLVAWYDFVQDTGTPQRVTDRVGGYHATRGTTAGTDTTDPTWTTTGLSFDGTDDSASTAGAHPVLYAPEFTVILAATLPVLGVNKVLAEINANLGWSLQVQADNTVSLTMQGDAGYTVAATAQAAVQNQPWITAHTVTAQTTQAYYGGAASGAAQPTGTPYFQYNGQPLVFGARLPGGPYTAMTAHTFLLYNRALSAGEVARATRALRRSLTARGITVP